MRFRAGRRPLSRTSGVAGGTTISRNDGPTEARHIISVMPWCARDMAPRMAIASVAQAEGIRRRRQPQGRRHGRCRWHRCPAKARLGADVQPQRQGAQRERLGVKCVHSGALTPAMSSRRDGGRPGFAALAMRRHAALVMPKHGGFVCGLALSSSTRRCGRKNALMPSRRSGLVLVCQD